MQLTWEDIMKRSMSTNISELVEGEGNWCCRLEWQEAEKHLSNRISKVFNSRFLKLSPVSIFGLHMGKKTVHTPRKKFIGLKSPTISVMQHGKVVCDILCVAFVLWLHNVAQIRMHFFLVADCMAPSVSEFSCTFWPKKRPINQAE